MFSKKRKYVRRHCRQPQTWLVDTATYCHRCIHVLYPVIMYVNVQDPKQQHTYTEHIYVCTHTVLYITMCGSDAYKTITLSHKAKTSPGPVCVCVCVCVHIHIHRTYRYTHTCSNGPYICTVCIQVATIAHLPSLDDPGPPRQGGLPHASFKGGLFATEEGTIDPSILLGICGSSVVRGEYHQGAAVQAMCPQGIQYHTNSIVQLTDSVTIATRGRCT